MTDTTANDKVNNELVLRLQKLRSLRIEHRDLDDVISRLQLDYSVDELQIKRLKRRKLMLKDQITRLESELIPDLKDRKSTRLNSSHIPLSRMPSSA